jgi:anaerobic magnesium-protoporphyrin IX monomethyl ester cyclase
VNRKAMLILYNPAGAAQPKAVLPMSLLALGALLEGNHDYRIVDGNLEPDPVGAIHQALQHTQGAILGVTVMPGPQLGHAVAHSRELKAMHPDLTIVWGGYFPTQHYEVCLCADYVDYVVCGHAEGPFRELVEALQVGQDPASVAGLAYRDRQTGHIVTNPRALVPDPAGLPDFPYHRVNMERYVRSTFMGQRTLAHHSSYGCPFTCSFCAVVTMVDGLWRAQPAERVAATARRLVREWGADAVEFYDNNFFVHEARTAEFAERIMDLDIGWWGESRIDTLLNYSDRTWQLMRDSGLRMAFLGAESGSDETLRQMNKGGTASTASTLEIAEKMAHYSIVPEMSFVLGNPPDPEADVRRTIEFIRKLKRVNPHTEVVLYMYTPVPLAGKLYEQAVAAGFQFPATLEEWIGPEWQEFSQRRSTQMPWVQDPLRRQIQDFERVLNAYYPTTTDVKLQGGWRWLLKTMSAWRYHLQVYSYPLELQALHKVVAYQRPETSGF